MTDPQLVTLSAPGAEAKIALAGAEWRTWRIAGRDLLWSGESSVWPATAPLLFPVCGWTREGSVRVGARSYPLGLHGFASRMTFAPAGQGDDFVRLSLTDNAATRALYPFGFRLDVEYRLTVRQLTVEARVANRGRGPMPYAFGLHPGFRWPFAGGETADYAIRFDAVEAGEVPVIAPGGLVSARRRAVPLGGGRRLALTPETFAHEALCFLDAANRGLRFEAPGGPALRVDVTNFPHLVLWSCPPAPFLCIETWTGFGDPEGFEGDLFAKPSMIVLAPGEARGHTAVFSFEGP
jgi:galactose mutarotase-like enzyme